MTENRTGFDFSRVRVHTDAKAAESAKAVGAIAYTVGHDVFFSHGSYKPQTESGLRLLTHELAHTLQQAEGTAEKDELEITSRGDPTEAEAENFSEAAAAGDHIVTLSGKHQTIARQVAGQTEPTQKCVPAPGIPNANCGAYLKNSWWLPWAYVRNATCACETTPNVPTANCVRKFLQDRLAATPMWLKVLAASQKGSDIPGSASYPAYQLFVQSFLTPRIYHDHVDAYRSCCCPSGPAPYGDWVLTTLVPSPACSLVDVAIRYFGSCSGTPGSW